MESLFYRIGFRYTRAVWNETFKVTTSLENIYKETGMTYRISENNFKNGGLKAYTKVMLENYKLSAPQLMEKLKKMGYKNFQAITLFKDGNISPSSIEKIE